MSLSTSLDDLLGPEGGNKPSMQSNAPIQQTLDNNQFVDAILTELEDMPDYGQDQNAARQQYSMNPDAHVPPPQLGDTSKLLKGEDTRLGSVIDLTDKFTDTKSRRNDSFIVKYKKEMIATGLFMILMFILSLHQVNRIIFGFVPTLILENGQISILGILFKTVIGTLIFGLVIFLT
jgi:hypothetical protein